MYIFFIVVLEPYSVLPSLPSQKFSTIFFRKDVRYGKVYRPYLFCVCKSIHTFHRPLFLNIEYPAFFFLLFFNLVWLAREIFSDQPELVFEQLEVGVPEEL